MGPTMDVQLLGELFSSTSAAAGILGIDKDFSDSLAAATKRFPPMRADSRGRLMEWLEEYAEVEPQHRHVSHLYGLHPGNSISTLRSPELAEACRNTLKVRGDGGTGWSRAWKINFYARLGDGDHALKLLKALLAPALRYSEIDTLSVPYYNGNLHLEQFSGTFPNLFCSHPPFQIDGNFGGTSGITEMLLQSQDGYIVLLPALPSGWRSGSARGLRARGNVSVDFNWNDSRVEQVTITGLPLRSGEDGRGSVASGEGSAVMDGPGSGATDGPDSVASGNGGTAMDGLTAASTDDGGTVTAGGRYSVVLKVPAGSIARDLYGNEFPTDSSGFVHISVRSGESVTIRFGR